MASWIIPQEIDLSRGENALDKHNVIRPLAYPGNNKAHIWKVTVNDNGIPFDLSECSVYAYFKRTDGNVVLLEGTVNNNDASVEFAPEVYAIPGIVKAEMNITVSGEFDTPIGGITFNVLENMTGNIIDPGSIIPASIDDLLDLISEMRDATDAAEAAATKAVRYDSSQGLTDSQKSQARSNIGLSFADSGDGDIIIS